MQAPGSAPARQESACLERMTLVLLACISCRWASRPADRTRATESSMNCHILYHDNCFDGACSAAVFMRFYLSKIEPRAGFQLFGMAHQPSQTFPDHLFEGDENAIVDFKYASHERLTWWFDHHYSAFLTPEDEAHFRSRNSDRMFHDTSYKSCTKMIATIGHSRFGFDAGVLEDLIHWADIVDGALYASAREAVEVGEPAPEAGRRHRGPTATPPSPTESSASSPDSPSTRWPPRPRCWTATGPCTEPFREHPHHPGGLRVQPRRDLLRPDPLRAGGLQRVHPLPSPPECEYHVSLMQSPQRTKISVGSNPWSPNPRRHNLARICERYGGGGHPVVAAISFPPDQPQKARQQHGRSWRSCRDSRVIHEVTQRFTKDHQGVGGNWKGPPKAGTGKEQ